MAPSGEQDKFDDKRHVVTMSAFGKATNQMMIDACKEGAPVSYTHLYLSPVHGQLLAGVLVV